MEVFTEEELKVPPVKYECNDIRRSVFRHIRNFIFYYSFCCVLFKHGDKLEKM
jgi:hypothetical protein